MRKNAPKSRKTNTFCVLPWIQLEVRTDGTLAPCCASRDRLKGESGKVLHLSRDSLEDAFSSPTLQKLRKDLNSGKKAGNCQACWDDERFGRESIRISMNRSHPDLVRKVLSLKLPPTQPRRLDLKMGRTCNLKCRICGPASSSKWHEEFIAVEGEESWKKSTLYPDLIDRWADREENWETLRGWLPKLESIHFLGGEPFLNKKYMDLLRYAVSDGFSRKLRVSFLSNGTIFPEKAIAELFPQFSEVHVGLSLDGLDEQFEYQRHPARWNQVIENLARFRESGCSVRIEPTISALNSIYAGRYERFWVERGLEVNFGFVHSPAHLSLRAYPAGAKSEISRKLFEEFGQVSPLFKTILRNMNAPGDVRLWRRFVSSVTAHDRYRSESFERAFPELFSILRPYWKSDLSAQDYRS